MNQLSATLIGALVSTLATVIVLTFRDEHHVPLSSFLIGVGAGLFVGIVLGLVGEWRKRRQDRWAYQEQQLRSDGKKLKALESEIFDAQHNLRRSLRPGNDLVDALNRASELFGKLRSLAIDRPDLEEYDFDMYMSAVEWESFLSELYPLARASDITRARRLWRLTWRFRLSRWGRLSWRSLSGWCRFRLRRLRSTLKRSKQGRTRQRGRRSGSARSDSPPRRPPTS